MALTRNPDTALGQTMRCAPELKPVCPPELKVRTPAHTNYSGGMLSFESWVTQRCPHHRPPASAGAVHTQPRDGAELQGNTRRSSMRNKNRGANVIE